MAFQLFDPSQSIIFVFNPTLVIYSHNVFLEFIANNCKSYIISILKLLPCHYQYLSLYLFNYSAFSPILVLHSLPSFLIHLENWIRSYFLHASSTIYLLTCFCTFCPIIKDELSMSLSKAKPAIKSYPFLLLKNLALEILPSLSRISFFPPFTEKFLTNLQTRCSLPHSKSKKQRAPSHDSTILVFLLLQIFLKAYKHYLQFLYSYSLLSLFQSCFCSHHNILATFNLNTSG